MRVERYDKSMSSPHTLDKDADFVWIIRVHQGNSLGHIRAYWYKYISTDNTSVNMHHGEYVLFCTTQFNEY